MNIMIQGTTSSAGKSLVTTGLCRIFKDMGLKVYPFKSQNMSRNYVLTKEGTMVSTAQALQAIACGIDPHSNMNPILMVPCTDSGSAIVVGGIEHKVMEAREYFEFRKTLRQHVIKIYNEVSENNDIVVIEGGGSPAEINLRDNDLVNMGMARIADAPVLLVADIERGGVFASIYGTYMLLEPDERERIKGFIINKFRGDVTLLDSGIDKLFELTGVPVLGVIPYTHFELVDEDSLSSNEKLCNSNPQSEEERELEINKLADVLRANLDMEAIFSIANLRR